MLCISFQDLVNGFRCSCATGWDGDRCQSERDECRLQLCLNGATCIVRQQVLHMIACTDLHVQKDMANQYRSYLHELFLCQISNSVFRMNSYMHSIIGWPACNAVTQTQKKQQIQETQAHPRALTFSICRKKISYL